MLGLGESHKWEQRVKALSIGEAKRYDGVTISRTGLSEYAVCALPVHRLFKVPFARTNKIQATEAAQRKVIDFLVERYLEGETK